MQQVAQVLFADLIGTTRELTLRLLTPIIRKEKGSNAAQFETYLGQRRHLRDQKSNLAALIKILRDHFDEQRPTLFEEFDSLYCVTSIETFLQSEIDFGDQNAELYQQLLDEIEHFKKYVEAWYGYNMAASVSFFLLIIHRITLVSDMTKAPSS